MDDVLSGRERAIATAAGYRHYTEDPAWHIARSILENERATAEENPDYEPRTGRDAHRGYDGIFDGCSTGENPARWSRVGRYLAEDTDELWTVSYCERIPGGRDRRTGERPAQRLGLVLVSMVAHVVAGDRYAEEILDEELEAAGGRVYVPRRAEDRR